MKSEDNCGLGIHCRVERQICSFGNFKENTEPITLKLGKGKPEWALGGTHRITKCACILSIY